MDGRDGLSQKASFSGRGCHPMSAETQAIRIPEKIMRQIRSDSQAALSRARVNPSRNDLIQLRCVDHRHETDADFGAQLWYFDAQGSSPQNRKIPVYGVLEYSIQYGLHELVDDGVFDSMAQRDRFHSVYRRGHLAPSLWHPSHRWLALGMMIMLIVAFVLKVLPRLFAA
jgi:hypothetical protein